MPTIGNNVHTLLHGLSDFWVRFFADYDELNAFYQGLEISLAQVYLDLLSDFLNVSLIECPIFNTEFFKLIAIREDAVTFEEGQNADLNRYVVDMPDNLAVGNLLQNKVIDPTAVLETGLDYDQDATNYKFRFQADPSGRSGLIVGTTNTGSLLTYGTGLLTRFYTVNADETPFVSARVGQWLQISESGSGNNNIFPIKEVIDGQAVLLGGTFTLPEGNNGHLVGQLFEIEFVSEPGFANRTVNVDIGGSFDDPTYRATSSMSSWYFELPRGVGVKKGDIIRALGSSDPVVKDAIPTLPADFPITVVRHDKLYFAPTEALQKSVTAVRYVILRTPPNSQVMNERITFTLTAPVKPTTPLYNGELLRIDDETVFRISPSSPTVFASSDQGKHFELTGAGDIIWIGTLDAEGHLVRTGGAPQTPLAQAVEGGVIEIAGTLFPEQNGQYYIESLDNEADCTLTGSFLPDTVTARLIGVTNTGPYRVKRVIDNYNVVLDRPCSCPDLAGSSLGWQTSNGYQASLDNTRIVYDSLEVNGVTGTPYEGGYRIVVEGTDYTVDYEGGVISQIGRFAGRWGLGPPEMTNASYQWLREIVTEQLTGVFSTTSTTLPIREVALWVPDARVDKYHLYNNYGQYINRFQPSSEAYRGFIRGVFQLYVLGPALRHVESALNVIAGFPVARDDGEYLLSYTADADHKYVKTQRVDGTYTYVFDVRTALREDIEAWVTGSATITFQAFEPFTEMFIVTDYIEDPVWWENIVIPGSLMPDEGSERRTTLPMLFDNVIGAIDGPCIGDYGLFIGADEDGVVPEFYDPSSAGYAPLPPDYDASLPLHVQYDYSVYPPTAIPIPSCLVPAKRRKMANVVMDKFIKYHMFYVSFNANLADLVALDFIQDLRELVLIAKPGYALAYIEPASNFIDTMIMYDPPVEIGGTWDEADGILVGNSLYVESGTWPIGCCFRPGTPVHTVLLVATGATIPSPVSLPGYLAGVHVSPPAGVTGFYGEPRDFTLDRYTGLLTPKTVWPAGVYLVDYRPLITTPPGLKDPSLGDTDVLIGGLNPIIGHCQMEYYRGGSLALDVPHGYVVFTSQDPIFIVGLHEGVSLTVHHPIGIRPFKVMTVLSTTQVVIDNPTLSGMTDLLWSFSSREPWDGLIYPVGGGIEWRFRSPSGMFRHIHKEQHIWVRDAVLSSGRNNGHWPIIDVYSPSEVRLDPGGTVFVTESNLHWRLWRGGNMSFVEQPLQIRVY